MKEYGKPMPFPCKDFEVTLEKCVKTVEPYAENLVDKKMGIKKIIYTIRYMGTEKEIDGLRKQIMGHYQALNMCISFLQLYVCENGVFSDVLTLADDSISRQLNRLNDFSMSHPFELCP